MRYPPCPCLPPVRCQYSVRINIASTIAETPLLKPRANARTVRRGMGTFRRVLGSCVKKAQKPDTSSMAICSMLTAKTIDRGSKVIKPIRASAFKSPAIAVSLSWLPIRARTSSRV